MADPAEAAHRRYYASVYRYVRRRTRSREDAEDLTQGVFAEVMSTLGRTAEESSPTLALLYTVAQRRIIDEQRRRYSAPAEVISIDVARLQYRPDSAYGIDLAHTIASAVAALPREQQQVVTLKLVEGRRFAEISAFLGVSEQACRARLSRALRTLRVRLAEEGIAP